MLPPNSYWDYHSQEIENIFPNLSSISNKPQSSAKIQLDKLISPLSLQQLEPSTSTSTTEKRSKNKVEETVYLCIFRRWSPSKHQISMHKIFFKHYTCMHLHQTKIITEVPHIELQLPHCKDTIASKKKSLRTGEIGEIQATKEVIFNSSKQGYCQKDKPGSYHIMISRLISFGALFPQK